MALDTYLISFLGDLATDLDWTVADVVFAVDDSVEAYGETSEADCTDLVKLHAIGKVKILEAVLRATAGAVDFSADSASYKMSQMNSQARELLADAEREALPYLPGYAIETGELEYPSDPYERVEPFITGEEDD